MPFRDDDLRLKLDHAENLVESALRQGGLIPDPALPGEIHPLASAGIRLKDLRVRSGWTAIAGRTGIALDILAAFEDGDSFAAGTMTTFEVAICLLRHLGPEHSWVQAARRRQFGFGRGCAVYPHE